MKSKGGFWYFCGCRFLTGNRQVFINLNQAGCEIVKCAQHALGCLICACISRHLPPVSLIMGPRGAEVAVLHFSLAALLEGPPRLRVTQLLKDRWSTCQSTDFKRCLGCVLETAEKNIFIQWPFARAALGCLIWQLTGAQHLGLRILCLPEGQAGDGLGLSVAERAVGWGTCRRGHGDLSPRVSQSCLLFVLATCPLLA